MKNVTYEPRQAMRARYGFDPRTDPYLCPVHDRILGALAGGGWIEEPRGPVDKVYLVTRDERRKVKLSSFKFLKRWKWIQLTLCSDTTAYFVITPEGREALRTAPRRQERIVEGRE